MKKHIMCFLLKPLLTEAQLQTLTPDLHSSGLGVDQTWQEPQDQLGWMKEGLEQDLMWYWQIAKETHIWLGAPKNKTHNTVCNFQVPFVLQMKKALALNFEENSPKIQTTQSYNVHVSIDYKEPSKFRQATHEYI